MSTPEEIITKDTSLDDAIEKLNKEITLATETVLADIPSEYISYPRALSNKISYDDCQYTLTNNGVELIEPTNSQKIHHAHCKLKSPRHKEALPNVLYTQLSPHQNIIFCNLHNNQTVAIKPEMIDNIILLKNSVQFDTYDYGTYELILNEESLANNLAKWLATQYNLNVVIR